MVDDMRAKFLQIMKYIATLGSLGYMPASGTLATIVTLPAVLLLKYMHVSVSSELTVIAILIGVAWIVIHYAAMLFPFSSDPRQIVLDEVIGTFCAFSCVTVSSFKVVMITVLLFRYFDIVKPLGIYHFCQSFSGARGILLDDIVAGLYTTGIIALFQL